MNRSHSFSRLTAQLGGKPLLALGAALLFSLSLSVKGQSLSVTNGLQLWLKADSGISTNAAGNVTEWADQSGNNHHALQPDEAAAPMLVANAITNKPAVHFDGDDDFMDVASTEGLAIVGDISSYFVVKFEDFINYRAVWGKTVGNLPGPTDYYLVINSGIPRL